MKNYTFLAVVVVAFGLFTASAYAGKFVIPEGPLRSAVDNELLTLASAHGQQRSTSMHFGGKTYDIRMQSLNSNCIVAEVVVNGDVAPASMCNLQGMLYANSASAVGPGHWQSQQQVVHVPSRVVTRQVRYPHATVTPLHQDPNAVRGMAPQGKGDEFALMAGWNDIAYDNERIRRYSQDTDINALRAQARLRRFNTRTITETVNNLARSARHWKNVFK